MSVRNRELSQYSTPTDVVDAVIQRYFAELAPLGTILDPLRGE
jgi:flagella basal body P-ring formation protein FlgA